MNLGGGVVGRGKIIDVKGGDMKMDGNSKRNLNGL